MSLTALLANRTTPSAKKSAGITVTDPVIVAAVGEWIVLDTACEEAEAARTAAEVVLKPTLRRAFFAANAGRTSPESSLKIVTPRGTLTTSFAAQWFPKTENLADIGIPRRMVRKKASIKIDVDKIPAEKQDDVVAAILAALDANQCGDALTAKIADYPTAAFATERFTAMTPEQNEELEIAGLGTRMSMRR